MESKVKLLGHPIHQILIVFPIGLLMTGVIFDVIYILGGNENVGYIAYWMLLSGVVGGFIAAPFGLIDWLAIPEGTRAKTVGGLHGAGNVVVLVLFIWSLVLRSDLPGSPGATALLLSILGGGLALVTGWLGGELVNRLGIGVSENANPNAPSSLSDGSMRKHQSARAGR